MGTVFAFLGGLAAIAAALVAVLHRRSRRQSGELSAEALRHEAAARARVAGIRTDVRAMAVGDHSPFGSGLMGGPSGERRR
ncbi:hypothetical protein [Streptomyces indicus]|nr:hypothetical protein [Streptomyces indicus]